MPCKQHFYFAQILSLLLHKMVTFGGLRWKLDGRREKKSNSSFSLLLSLYTKPWFYDGSCWCGDVDSWTPARSAHHGISNQGKLRPRMIGSLLGVWCLFQLQGVNWGRTGTSAKRSRRMLPARKSECSPGPAQHADTWLTDAAATACSALAIIRDDVIYSVISQQKSLYSFFWEKLLWHLTCMLQDVFYVHFWTSQTHLLCN